MAYATEALKYLEGIQTARPQALLYGTALRQDRDPSGKPVLRLTTERYIVHAERPGQSFEATVNETNEFELVLTPAEYRVWLTLNGQRVSDVSLIQLNAGDTVLRTLGASF
jgi:hypothetical protein